ncbi:MAG: DUF3025 domain-containing protein [Betaproteobacteria bacterium]
MIQTSVFSHPAYAPFLPMLADGALPDLAQLNRWAAQRKLALDDGTSLRFVVGAPGNALAYEQAIATRGDIGLRADNWHDAFNALVWLALPRTKSALNAHHVASTRDQVASPHARTRERDAATLIDESGMILACDDEELVDLLRRHAWRELLVERRARVDAAFLPLVIGHGLLDKLRAPFRGITAHVLVVPRGAASTSLSPTTIAVLDQVAAARIRATPFTPPSLLPLPVAGLSGWDTEGLGPRLFDDISVFRPSVLV